MNLLPEIYRQAQELIAAHLGLDFPEGRHAELERGLPRGCRTALASGPETYLAWLETLLDQDPEWGRLAGHLTVGETYFIRGRACFEALEQVLTALMAGRLAEGLRCLRDAGGVTIVQDEESNVVFGMPREAIRLGAVAYVLALAQMAEAIRPLARQE